jgi:hypothetical protein
VKSIQQLRICSYLALAPLLMAGAVHAVDPAKAKATVDNIRGFDAHQRAHGK